MIEIFGIKSDANLVNVNDLFNLEYESDEEVNYISKKEFLHQEDGLSFYYHYMISAIYCEGYWNYDLSLVVSPKSMTKEMIDGILDCCGLLDVEDINFNDAYWYGGSNVSFGSIAIKSEDIDTSIFDKIATIYEVCDSLRGFYIDRPWNRISTTGWDTIRHCVLGTELFKF